MARWNISGDTVTLEDQRRRSPMRWLRQNGLKIAVVLGVVEAIAAFVFGFKFLMLAIGVIAVLGYLNIRHRLPESIRRPVWVIVTAQAIAGLLVPAVYAGMAIAFVIGTIMLVILLLVLLGDRRR
ncbi:MAG: hypothetical protein ACTHNU_09600 [Gaiellales bacterium]